MTTIKEKLIFITEIVRQAAEIVLAGIGQSRIVDYKIADDFYVEADLKSEEFIVNAILKEFPEHNIITEEKRSIDQGSDYTWVLDPIDGTKNYHRGIPLFAISIALKHKGEYVLGIVYNPATKELFTAVKGKGAYKNGKKIKVSQPESFEHAMLVVEFPGKALPEEKRKEFKGYFDQVNDIVSRTRNLGSAASELCYTACGGFDGFMDLSGTTKEWDIAAGSLILKEAGGVFEILPNEIKIGGSKEVVEEIKRIIL